MKALPVILMYILLSFIELSFTAEKMQKKQLFIFILAMIISLVLSINIAVGTNMPSINSVVRKLLYPILKQS